MADRNWRTRNSPRERYRGAPDDRQESNRQQEQFSTDYDWDYDDYGRSTGQMGESAYGRSDYGQSDPVYAMEWDRHERYPRAERGNGARERDYPATGRYNYGPARIEGPGRGFASFTSEDQGGRDFTAPTRPRRYGWQDYRTPSGYGYPGETIPARYYRAHERGFFDRAADEVSSWFGDEDAARRRELDHSGRGPQNYTRSDERILEDACDNLTDDWGVDARNVQVTVSDHEVTLDGTVPSRQQKRRAEDCVEWVSGVTHVQNNLRVDERQESEGREAARAQGESTTGTLG
jgi:osmotically-inducible protein OsmY